MTKRRVVPLDLDWQNLVAANTDFNIAHGALAEMKHRMEAGEEVDPEEGALAFASFLAAAVALYKQSNQMVILANADRQPLKKYPETS